MLQNKKYMFCSLVQAFNSLIALEAGIHVDSGAPKLLKEEMESGYGCFFGIGSNVCKARQESLHALGTVPKPKTSWVYAGGRGLSHWFPLRRFMCCVQSICSMPCTAPCSLLPTQSSSLLPVKLGGTVTPHIDLSHHLLPSLSVPWKGESNL